MQFVPKIKLEQRLINLGHPGRIRTVPPVEWD